MKTKPNFISKVSLTCNPDKTNHNITCLFIVVLILRRNMRRHTVVFTTFLLSSKASWQRLQAGYKWHVSAHLVRNCIKPR